MGAKRKTDAVIGVGPCRMMVHLLRLKRDLRDKGEGLGKIFKGKIAVQFPRLDTPIRQVLHGKVKGSCVKNGKLSQLASRSVQHGM